MAEHGLDRARGQLPDLIVVVTDQHRAGLSRREGFPLDTTPFIDELATSGVWFDRAYTTSPLCCPARTSLMTGRFPSAHRVTQNPAVGEAVFEADLPGVARAAGYKTALVAKNHTYLGPEDVDAFVEFGHDGRIGAEVAGSAAEFDAWLASLRHRTPTEPAPFDGQVQNPHRIVDAALDWIATVPDDRPALLIVSFPEPHNPYQVPEPYFSMFAETMPPTATTAEVLPGMTFPWQYLRRLGETGHPDYAETIDRARASYVGMLRLIDDEVRRLYAGLARRHASRPRVLAMTADHGDFVGEYGLVRKGAEIPDVLARIPMVITGDLIAGSAEAHDAHVSIADLFPTCCEAIGVPIPFGVQGRSLWPMLTHQDYPAEEFASVYVEQGMGGLPYGWLDVDSTTAADTPGLFHDGPHGEPRFDELNAATQSGRRRKVRRGDHSLYADLTGDFRLYDLRADPFELDDLWPRPELAEVRERLLCDLVVWQLRAEDPLPAVPDGYRMKSDRHGYLAPYATATGIVTGTGTANGTATGSADESGTAGMIG